MDGGEPQQAGLVGDADTGSDQESHGCEDESIFHNGAFFAGMAVKRRLHVAPVSARSKSSAGATQMLVLRYKLLYACQYGQFVGMAKMTGGSERAEEQPHGQRRLKSATAPHPAFNGRQSAFAAAQATSVAAS